MAGTVWQILNCMKFTHFIPESEILRSCFEKFVMCKYHTGKLKIDVNLFMASFLSMLPIRRPFIRQESRPKRHRRWNPDDFWNETSIWTTKASLIRYFILQFYLWGRGFSNFHWNEMWAMVATNAVTQLEKNAWFKISLHCGRVTRLKMINFTIWSKII